jgi:hypothetical protein
MLWDKIEYFLQMASPFCPQKSLRIIGPQPHSVQGGAGTVLPPGGQRATYVAAQGLPSPRATTACIGGIKKWAFFLPDGQLSSAGQCKRGRVNQDEHPRRFLTLTFSHKNSFQTF